MRQNAPDFDIEVALAVYNWMNETMKNDYYIILPNCFDAHIDGRFDRSKSNLVKQTDRWGSQETITIMADSQWSIVVDLNLKL